jgi:hypothetical protein
LDLNKRRKKTVKRTLWILTGVIGLVVVLYLWAIFRPTGLEQLRRESKAFIASVPERKQITPIQHQTGTNETKVKPKTQLEATECLQHGLDIPGLNLSTVSLDLLNTLQFTYSSYFSISGDDLEKGNFKEPSEKMLEDMELWRSYSEASKSNFQESLTPERMNLVLDHWEKCLFEKPVSIQLSRPLDMSLGSIFSSAAPGFLVVLRAAHQGDQEKVDQYLKTLFDMTLSTRTSVYGTQTFNHSDAWLLATLVIFLHEMDMVNPQVLSQLQESVRIAQFSYEEAEKWRLQMIQFHLARFNESMEHSYRLQSNRNLLENLLGGVPLMVSQSVFSPLIEKNIEDMEAAFLKNDCQAAQQSYEKSKRYYSLQFYQLESKQYPGIDLLIYDHQTVFNGEKSNARQYGKTLTSEVNNRLYMIDFVLASISYANRNGNWQETVEELIPEFLPESFPEDSRCYWKIHSLENKQGKPIDIFACHDLAYPMSIKNNLSKEHVDEYWSETTFTAIVLKDDLNKCLRLFDQNVKETESGNAE